MKASLWRRLYTVLFHFLLPFVLMRLLWRAAKAPAYAKRWRERFGCFNAPDAISGGIWLHAVSLGESKAAVPLIKALQQRYPETPLTITTTTPTGSKAIQTDFADRVFHIYAPYDLPWAVTGFLSKVKPRLAIIMETELWPNLLAQCHKREIPVVLANGRLSVPSAKGYRRIRALARQMLDSIDLLAAQSASDAERFIALGMDSARVEVTGNLKFDQDIPQSVSEIAEEVRSQWGQRRPAWVAASTHEGEEELILHALARVQKAIPDSILLVVPRHPERFQKVASLFKRQGYKVGLRSDPTTVSGEIDVFIGDTMGELATFYAASDIAFVGGSLMPIGGHNILEPAALGIPSIVGPYYFNSTDVTELLIDSGATGLAPNIDVLSEQVINLLQDGPKRGDMGEAGLKLVADNRGAVKAHLTLMERLNLPW